MKMMVGVSCEVLVMVDFFIFIVDFVIHDCEVYFDVPVILERPFLAMTRELGDMERI